MFVPIIISGPSAVGKDTLIKAIKNTCPNINEAVGYTTRAPRPGETNGVDLNFVSKEFFMELIKKDLLIEYAIFNNEYYGMPKHELLKSKDQLIIFNVGISGAKAIKNIVPNAISILLIPPSYEELINRLGNRDIKRLDNLESDLHEASTFFDYCLVSETNNIKNVVKNFFKIINGNTEEFELKKNIKKIEKIKKSNIENMALS